MSPFAIAMLVTSLAANPADRGASAERGRLALISIEDVDARATIAGCLAREAAARNKPQPSFSHSAVRAEVERQAKVPRRLEQCRRVLAED
jgi:hypothetical protein